MITYRNRLVWREFPEQGGAGPDHFENYPRNKCHPAKPHGGWCVFIPLLEYKFEVARILGPVSVLAGPRDKWRETLMAEVDRLERLPDDQYEVAAKALESLIQRIQALS
jgi:hypothetical protein